MQFAEQRLSRRTHSHCKVKELYMNNESMNSHKLQFSEVSQQELFQVSGGGIISWIKKAAVWVKDHIWVDPKTNSGGVKGKF